MAGRCIVYGRFVSAESAEEFFTLAEQDAGSYAKSCGLTESTASAGSMPGHKQYVISKDGSLICSFWLGPAGSSCLYDYQGKTIPLGPSTGILHGASMDPAQKGNGADSASIFMIKKANELLYQQGSSRLVVFLAEPLSDDVLKASGLYLLGESIQKTPHDMRFRLSMPWEGILKRTKSFFRRLFPTFASSIYSFITARSYKRFLLSGDVLGQNLSIAFIGPERSARFYSGLLFDPCRFSELKEKSDGIAPDAIMRMCRGKNACTSKGGQLIFPFFIRSMYRLSGGFGDFESSLCGSAQRDLVKIRKAGFTHEISKDPLDLFLFYHSMHKPMLKSRHGQSQILMDLSEAESFFRRGFLLFVKRGPARLGAMLLVEYDSKLLMKLLGIAEGDFGYTRSGAGAALYYFSIKHAFENGFKMMDFGLSSSFGSDGISSYKRKWKASAFYDRGSDLICASFKDENMKKIFVERYQPLLIDALPECILPD